MLFFDKEARRKAAILLMSAFNAGQCIDLSRSAWLVHDLQTSHFVMAVLLELGVKLPKNERKKPRPTSHPTGGMLVLQKARGVFANDMKAILRCAELNLDALNTVDLGPKRPFSVGKCALWARLAEPQLAA
jgi:hypothetical protein